MKKLLRNSWVLFSLLFLLIKLEAVKSKDKEEIFKFFDLSSAANMGFEDKIANDKKGGWTDQGPTNDLKEFPTGIQKFGGIYFKVINPSENNGKSCIVLKGQPRDYFPLESDFIPFNDNVSVLYFLLACAWNATPGKEIAKCFIQYDDPALFIEVPIVYGKHVSGWWRPQKVTIGEIAWEGFSGSSDVGVYSFGWVNPYPNKRIKGIKFISTNSSAVPIFIAVTGIKPSVVAEKLAGLIKEREKKSEEKHKPTFNARIEINFSKKIGEISPNIYSMAGGGEGPWYIPLAKELKPALYRAQIMRMNPSPAEGIWDFTQLNETVDFIFESGAKPMLCFGIGVPIWMAKRSELVRLYKPQNLQEYAEYCAKIVHYYNFERKTPIYYWEIGNEVELGGWSYRYYIKLYKVVAKRIKKVDPRIKVGGPVTCNPNIGWAEELLKNASELVDFISYHDYGYYTSYPYDTPNAKIMEMTPKYEKNAKKFRELIDKYKKDRNIELALTEVNVNPGYSPKTDPRIKKMFNAAWYASALGHFIKGGGDICCYFVLTGNFGCCGEKGKDLVTYPVYHTIWLYSHLVRGKVVETTSNAKTVEAFGFLTPSGEHGAIVINKNNHPVDVVVNANFEKNFGNKNKVLLTYILNKKTFKEVEIYDEKNEKVKTLMPSKSIIDKNEINFKMENYEVRALIWEGEK